MTTVLEAPARDVKFERTPVGYQLVFLELDLMFEARQVRWEHGSLYGIVSVRTRMNGVAHFNGVVTEQRCNLSGDRGRKDLANVCAERAPGIDLDWRGFVEELAIRIMASEREGNPFQTVGRLAPQAKPVSTIEPVIPAGMVAFFYGPGAATKGFLMTGLCVSLETGVTIIPGWAPRRGRTLYLDWESDEYDLDDRVKRIAKGANLPEVPEIGYRQCAGPLVDQVDDIEREVRRRGVRLLIVDSVGMALAGGREGGDANESTIRMFQALRRLGQLGCSVAAVDHVVGSEILAGKKSSRPYGSVYKTNLARNTYEVRALRSKPGEEGVTHITVTHRKTNTRAYLPTVGFAVLFGDDGSVRWEAEDVRQESDEPEGASEDQWPPSIRRRVREQLTKGHATAEQIASAIDEKPDSVRRVLNRNDRRASKAENQWFNKLPSGAWENLPLPGDPGTGGTPDAG